MRKILSAFIFSAVIVASAQAEFDNWYTSLNLGTSYFENVSYNGASLSGFSGPGASLFIGAPVNRYFAPELSVAYDRASTLGYAVITGLDFKLMAPVANNYLLFAKLGGGLAEVYTSANGSQETTDNTALMFGAGVGYRFLPMWMATLEFNGAQVVHASNANGVVGAVTLGITRFWPWWQ